MCFLPYLASRVSKDWDYAQWSSSCPRSQYVKILGISLLSLSTNYLILCTLNTDISGNFSHLCFSKLFVLNTQHAQHCRIIHLIAKILRSRLMLSVVNMFQLIKSHNVVSSLQRKRGKPCRDVQTTITLSTMLIFVFIISKIIAKL